ncbi:MAG: hypothetical protein KGH57_04350 [Candidatus Micrarchaeota archaeon]|nr:hypothetical protein [Candidatus Micrarchaeota archaeon]
MMEMEKRTTVILEKDVYDALVRESLEEYKTAKSLSKVLNEILKKSLMNKARLTQLIHSKKIAKITAKEFEKFRSEISNTV